MRYFTLICTIVSIIAAVVFFIVGDTYPQEFGVLAPRNQCMTSGCMCIVVALLFGAMTVVDFMYNPKSNK